MRAPEMEQCLCGGTVEKATKIIGWLSLIYRPLGVAYCLFGYYMTLDLLNHETFEPRRERLEYELTLIIMVGTVVTVLAIFDIILLIGVYKALPMFILIWIVVGVFSIIGSFMGIPCLVMQLPVGHILENLFTIGVAIYFLLIVSNHYRNLKAIHKKTQHTLLV